MAHTSAVVAAAAARTYWERSWASRLQHAQQGVLQVRVVERLAAFRTDGKLAGVEALLAHAVPTPAAGCATAVQHRHVQAADVQPPMAGAAGLRLLTTPHGIGLNQVCLCVGTQFLEKMQQHNNTGCFCCDMQHYG
jgi:hypothetical protein